MGALLWQGARPIALFRGKRGVRVLGGGCARFQQPLQADAAAAVLPPSPRWTPSAALRDTCGAGGELGPREPTLSGVPLFVFRIKTTNKGKKNKERKEGVCRGVF